MAALSERFDPTEHDTTQRDFTPLPDGIYVMEVVESDVVPTKDGTGERITATYSILAPEQYENRKIFAGINIKNKNPVAQKIGAEEFARLCRACGFGVPVNDTEELHFKSFTAKVGLEKKQANSDYAQRNEIKNFFFPDEGEPPAAEVKEVSASNDNKPAAAARTPAAKPAAATPPAAGKRPWATKAAA